MDGHGSVHEATRETLEIHSEKPITKTNHFCLACHPLGVLTVEGVNRADNMASKHTRDRDIHLSDRNLYS